MKFWRRKKITPVDILAGYANWAKNYPAQAHNPLMEIEQQAMLSLLPDNLNGKMCLDLACGSGRYLLLMQQRSATQLVGTDYSPEMLVKASYQLPIINYQLSRAPFFPLPFAAETFDLITCGLAVGHEKNLNRIVAEVARVLRPGGQFVYSDFHPFGRLLGWQRTFTAENGAVFSLEHYLHLYSHHQQACHAAGLTIDAVLEPLAGPKAPPEARHIPAVLVIRAVKIGDKESGRL
jgi:malonyl-CoA O-methyltransferase